MHKYAYSNMEDIFKYFIKGLKENLNDIEENAALKANKRSVEEIKTQSERYLVMKKQVSI